MFNMNQGKKIGCRSCYCIYRCISSGWWRYSSSSCQKRGSSCKVTVKSKITTEVDSVVKDGDVVSEEIAEPALVKKSGKKGAMKGKQGVSESVEAEQLDAAISTTTSDGPARKTSKKSKKQSTTF